MAITTPRPVSLGSLNCPLAQAWPGGSSNQRTRNDNRKGRGWLHARASSDFSREVPPEAHGQSAGCHSAQLHEGSIGLTKPYTAGLLGTLNMAVCFVNL